MSVYAVAADFTSRAGLTPRQVHYWTERGYLQAHNPNPGSGNHLRWPASELAVAEDMLRYLALGFTLAGAHRAARRGVAFGNGPVTRT